MMKRSPEKQLKLLALDKLPRELFVRQEQMPAQHFFPPHSHDWHQLLYAIAGVLVVDLEGERYFIPPNQAIWIPVGSQHSVYTEYGANLKSLYIARDYPSLNDGRAFILHITPLVRELILAVADFPEHYAAEGYEQNLVNILLQTLPRLKREEDYLPWPVSESLIQLCNRLYRETENTETTEQLAESIATSVRTLDRRFRKETGMSLKQWRAKLRLMKAIELLNTEKSITHIALELGYSSPSPFILMFREHLGISPTQYRKFHFRPNHFPQAEGES